MGHAVIAAAARSEGADARQAETAATILAGRDLALIDGDIDQKRLRALQPILMELMRDAEDSGVSSEGDDALDFLLSHSPNLDHSVNRTIRDLLIGVIEQTLVKDVEDLDAALGRLGAYVLPAKSAVAVRVGRHSPVSSIYANTKWQSGAHASVLLKLKGVSRPSSAIRFGSASGDFSTGEAHMPPSTTISIKSARSTAEAISSLTVPPLSLSGANFVQHRSRRLATN
jgi:hypothetical protein